MPPFPKPKFSWTYEVSSEKAALLEHAREAEGRQIPDKSKDRLLIATWNIANLGVQERRPEDYELIAELIGWFDLVAIQEVNDNLRGLTALRKYLPENYGVLFSDVAGNKEPQAFVFDTAKVSLGEKVGRLSIPVNDLRHIKLPGVDQAFRGFDRNPYLAAFRAGRLTLLLVNVHLFFGSDSDPADMDRRRLETFAVARWTGLRRRSQHAFTSDIIALGDFNLPRAEKGDPIFDALSARGLLLPPESSALASSIATESHYDLIAFFPQQTNVDFTGNKGVFDFDGAVFHELWETKSKQQFLSYVRYFLSDHRPMWAEFQI